MNTVLLVDVDWDKMFIPSMSLWEIIIRGSITYWFCFLYIRFFRRGAGQLGIADLLLITLISDAAQNSMAGEYDSITEGCLLVGVLVFWDYAINWLGFRSVFFSKIGEPDPVLLIKNGVMQRQNMKKELITSSELMSMLRQQGIEDVSEVKTCYIEGSGNISVIKS
ncbi:DUF421 domain-containing protein [Spirosoma validum]|uniref:DUF421 domain-containing protein n=1 Tax=Spirosoma validum TaxID=2771355 RepID=A0A927B336_9BACT|nr:YetF domain-containing protein [Spirosoma validum]MBD2754484.1 DUF421 domain-containing protein [Spirosoma validum]